MHLPSMVSEQRARQARKEAESALNVALSFPEGGEQENWLFEARAWERRAAAAEERAAALKALEARMRDAWDNRHSLTSGTRVLGELATASNLGVDAMAAREAVMYPHWMGRY